MASSRSSDEDKPILRREFDAHVESIHERCKLKHTPLEDAVKELQNGRKWISRTLTFQVLTTFGTIISLVVAGALLARAQGAMAQAHRLQTIYHATPPISP